MGVSEWLVSEVLARRQGRSVLYGGSLFPSSWLSSYMSCCTTCNSLRTGIASCLASCKSMGPSLPRVPNISFKADGFAAAYLTAHIARVERARTS